MPRIAGTLCRVTVSKIGAELSAARLEDRCPLQGKRLPPALVFFLRQLTPKPLGVVNATFALCSIKASPAVLPFVFIMALFSWRGPRCTHLGCSDVQHLLGRLC